MTERQISDFLARRGAKRAAVAVGHSILVIVYHLLKHGLVYKDLGANYFDQRDKRVVARRYGTSLMPAQERHKVIGQRAAYARDEIVPNARATDSAGASAIAAHGDVPVVERVDDRVGCIVEGRAGLRRVERL